MKTFLYLITVLVMLPLMSLGQQKLPNPRVYDSWYYPVKKNLPPRHYYTYSLNDSTVSVIKKSLYNYNITPQASDLEVIPVTDIKKICFRRKGAKAAAVVSSATLGLLAGIAVSVALANSDVEWTGYVPRPLWVLAPVFSFTGLGIGVGFSLGSIKKSLKIHGDPGTYQADRYRYKKYTIKYFIP